MIYDTLENREIYRKVHPGVALGLDFLAGTDFSQLEDGRYELDGDRVFANLMRYETKPANELPEAHREYIDIQFLVEGRELIGVAPLDEMEGVDSQPGPDCWLYRGNSEKLTVTGRRFLAVWPEDAHAPGIDPDGVGAPARKCVVKVKVEY